MIPERAPVRELFPVCISAFLIPSRRTFKNPGNTMAVTVSDDFEGKFDENVLAFNEVAHFIRQVL